MTNLFSYGTLQNEKTQQALFGRTLQGSPDALPGYKVETIEIEDEEFLSKEDKYQRIAIKTDDNKNSIEGTVLELTEEELLEADKYEPDNYKRIKVSLASGKEAWIYASV
ncbi:MAG TPA: gamma-glutamylcyclotransferase family protein [Ferruginibacter sp.]|nr:gamma-glutamylcyclotransferase family protein [Ferruginibacter sp.]